MARNQAFRLVLSSSAIRFSSTLSVARTRRVWTDEESKKLLELVAEKGKRWTFLQKHYFPDRPYAVLANRYRMLTDKESYHGPWTDEERERLRQLTKGHTSEATIDWDKLRDEMPRPRPIVQLQLTWRHSINPAIRHGRWTEPEIQKLDQLVAQYGTDDWVAVAQGVQSRTPRQCLERWKWQQDKSLKKGRYTAAEDKAILDAVAKYGENFAAVKAAIKSERTARHISQHYHYMLSKTTDRSPWTPEEEMQVYDLATKYNHDMKRVKEELKSGRAAKDLWNHYYKVKRQLEKEEEKKLELERSREQS